MARRYWSASSTRRTKMPGRRARRETRRSMPEGHTIHRLARDLKATLGREPVRASSPQGRFTAGAALLDGERIMRSKAWGKYLFVQMTGGQILHVHLGLIGKFRPVIDLDGPP